MASENSNAVIDSSSTRSNDLIETSNVSSQERNAAQCTNLKQKNDYRDNDTARVEVNGCNGSLDKSDLKNDDDEKNDTASVPNLRIVSLTNGISVNGRGNEYEKESGHGSKGQDALMKETKEIPENKNSEKKNGNLIGLEENDEENIKQPRLDVVQPKAKRRKLGKEHNKENISSKYGTDKNEESAEDSNDNNGCENDEREEEEVEKVNDQGEGEAEAGVVDDSDSNSNMMDFVVESISSNQQQKETADEESSQVGDVISDNDNEPKKAAVNYGATVGNEANYETDDNGMSTIKGELRRFLSKLRKQHLTKLTKSDLEELAIQKFCEALADRSDVGDLRRQNQRLLASLEAWHLKYKTLVKKMDDTQLIVKKYEFDMEKHMSSGKEGKPPPVPPRVLRSVGLQVCLPTIAPPSPSPSSSRANSPARGSRSVTAIATTTTNTITTTTTTTVTTMTTKRKSLPQLASAAPPPPPLMPKPLTNRNVATNNSPKSLQLNPRHATTSTLPMPSLKPKPMVLLTNNTTSNSINNIIVSSKVPTTVGSQRQPMVMKRATSDGGLVLAAQQQSPVASSTLVVSKKKPPVEGTGMVTRTAAALRPSTPAAAPQQPSIMQRVLYVSRPTTPVQGQRSATTSSPSVAKKRKSSADLIDLTEDEDRGGEDGAKLGSPNSQQSGNKTVYFIPKTVPVSQALMAVKQMHHLHTVTAPVTVAAPTNTTPALRNSKKTDSSLQHPAPLPMNDPPQPPTNSKLLLPAPSLTVQKAASAGVFLSWNMPDTGGCAKVLKYQLFAYPEGTQAPHSGLWKKVGDIDPLPLPMSCTLTNFNAGRIYHFAMRAVDIHGRYGRFSSSQSILL